MLSSLNWIACDASQVSSCIDKNVENVVKSIKNESFYFIKSLLWKIPIKYRLELINKLTPIHDRGYTVIGNGKPFKVYFGNQYVQFKKSDW